MSESRLEQLLEEGNALRRESLAVQREALALQKEALAAQRDLVERTRENLELARGVNQGAAELQVGARRAMRWLIPLIVALFVVLVAYVAWLMLFRYRG